MPLALKVMDSALCIVLFQNAQTHVFIPFQPIDCNCSVCKKCTVPLPCKTNSTGDTVIVGSITDHLRFNWSSWKFSLAKLGKEIRSTVKMKNR